MSIHLEVLWSGLDNVAIISVYNHLYRIYYTFKKDSRCVVVIEKEKKVSGDKGKICVYSNVSKKSAQGN